VHAKEASKFMDNLGTASTESFASRALYDKVLMTVKKKLQSVTGCAAARSESQITYLSENRSTYSYMTKDALKPK